MHEWVFSGIGTEIVLHVIGVLIGGFIGFKIGIRKNGKQKQVALDNVKQDQSISVDASDKIKDDRKEIVGNMQQYQKAGNNAEQKQIGKVK